MRFRPRSGRTHRSVAPTARGGCRPTSRPTDRLRIMPKMNPEEVARIAKLALIDLTEEEVEKVAGELDVIIDAVEVVSSAVPEDTPAASPPQPLANVFRYDAAGETRRT